MSDGPTTQESTCDDIIRSIMESAILIMDIGSEPKVYRTLATKSRPDESARMELMSPPRIRSRLGSQGSSI